MTTPRSILNKIRNDLEKEGYEVSLVNSDDISPRAKDFSCKHPSHISNTSLRYYLKKRIFGKDQVIITLSYENN